MTVDYIGSYVTLDGADLPRLINDDLLEPIKLLFQNEHYVSAAKLLMSAVDSIGFIEYGDNVSNPFKAWLNEFVDLSAIGVTDDELWEYRNSLLHMTNLESRRVLSGDVKRLIQYVGRLPPEIAAEDDDSKLFDLHALILNIIRGLEPWLQTYNDNPNKFSDFVKRYDLILSDKRSLRIDLEERNAK